MMTTDTRRNNQDEGGRGRIILQVHGDEAVFSELSYKYPLKLLSPRVHESTVAIAYMLSYGGGLVGGDNIHLDVRVDNGARLVLLTQGSTKVFKHRRDTYSPLDTRTTQDLNVTVMADGLLLLLPDPVTCFASATYDQMQVFRLDEQASAVILDWITAGRVSRGESWDFSRYCSINEVFVGNNRIARDALLLEESTAATGRSLKHRLGIYSCYATAIIYGSLNGPTNLLWSLTKIHDGCIIRVAAVNTEEVKTWLRSNLKPLEDVVGIDVYNKAFL